MNLRKAPRTLVLTAGYVGLVNVATGLSLLLRYDCRVPREALRVWLSVAPAFGRGIAPAARLRGSRPATHRAPGRGLEGVRHARRPGARARRGAAGGRGRRESRAARARGARARRGVRDRGREVEDRARDVRAPAGHAHHARARPRRAARGPARTPAR